MWSEILLDDGTWSALVYHLLVPRRLHLRRDAVFLYIVHLSCTRLEADWGLDQKTLVPALAQFAAGILEQKSKWCWFALIWQLSCVSLTLCPCHYFSVVIYKC